MLTFFSQSHNIFTYEAFLHSVIVDGVSIANITCHIIVFVCNPYGQQRNICVSRR